ncbi:glycosyltransferase family 2 protein [Pleurocapsales cyanobacterium LEGE 10410]|nr:glycosyltransferase family 2 protein [Pleurocapsales cyanobacterium LEGE 10410]
MKDTLLSIIIPTYNRPKLLLRAVNSALAQNIEDFEVIVVDDCSSEPIHLPEHPRLRIIHLPENKGGSAARNIGTRAAKGHWIIFLDDDDELLPHMAEVSLQALQQSSLPKPVGAISGIEVVNREGKVIQTRIPPTLPRGSHYGLEDIDPAQSFLCKQTLIVEKEVLLSMGGFDESLPSRIHTDLFLRLNLVCSLLGIDQVGYRLYKHDGFQISSDPTRRQAGFDRIVEKHHQIFQAHPKMYANFIYEQVITSYNMGQFKAGLKNLSRAVKVSPQYTCGRMFYTVINSIKRSFV